MKTMILAGGLGTRLSEETELRPKPMVEIGDKPILWHIMKIYSYYGYNDFLVLLGYKGYQIKEYFANYLLHQSDVTINLQNNQMELDIIAHEPWRVTLTDTGYHTMTGGRILRAEHLVHNESFMLTYGDGVGDINIGELIDFHKSHGKILTMTVVQPEGRFGAVTLGENGKVLQFQEKPHGEQAWINAGFFVCEHGIFDYIKDNDETVFERSPLEALAAEGELMAFKHYGFWKPMDTLRDKQMLNQLWQSGKAQWKLWK